MEAFVDHSTENKSVSGKPTASSDMARDDSGMFPISAIIAGFCVMSLAYLICFCCCIIQFFVRRNRTNNSPSSKLKNQFCRQYLSSLKRFNKIRPPNLAFIDSSCVGCCPICLEEYSGDPAVNFVGVIKTCGHFFHFDCIWEWLANHKRMCPLCYGPTQLTESDIKGLALRHVDAYKECVRQSKNGTKEAPKCTGSDPVIEAGTSVEGVKMTEEPITVTGDGNASEHACVDNIVVTVDIEGAGANQVEKKRKDSGENGDACEVTIVTPSRSNPNHTNNTNSDVTAHHGASHDNQAFVIDHEIS